MKRITPLAATLPLICALAACSPSGNDPGPGGVTVDEAEALDEAAEMVEARQLPDSALPEQLEADAPVELPPGSPASDPSSDPSSDQAEQPAPNQTSGE